MKYAAFILLIFLVTLSSCSSEKRVAKASNKIYNLTQKYPELLNEKDTALSVTATLPSFTLNSQHVISNKELEKVPLYVIKDSLNIITITKTNDSTYIDVQTTCPEQEVTTQVPFSYRQILANCNCKSEIKAANKSIRKKLRIARLQFYMALIIILAYTGFRAYRLYLKIKSGGVI